MNTSEAPALFAKRVRPDGGGLNLDEVLADLRRLGDPPEVLEQVLTDAQRSQALRPWRLYALRALQELAAQDRLNRILLERLWRHTLSLLDVFGEEELDRTLTALSYSKSGLEFLARDAMDSLYRAYEARDPGVADWITWVLHAAGLLAERKMRLASSQTAILEKVIGRRPEARRRDDLALLSFHRG